MRRPAEPPLRYRWDRISAIAATVVLMVVWLRMTTAEASADHRRASPRPIVAASSQPVAARPQPRVTASVPASAPASAPASSPASTPASTPAAESCAFGHLNRNLHENLVAPGTQKTRTVALTFDDGPSEYTAGVLKILHEQNIRATFFIIGRQAQAMPQVVTEESRQGHQVGNHSWSHRTPSARTGWAPQQAVQEVDRTNALLTRLTGRQPCLFRPPGGVVKGIGPVARARQMAVTLWSVDTKDWLDQKGQASLAAAGEIVAAARAGLQQQHPILLMHDGGGYRGATVAALPQIIAEYRARGYSFVTVAGQGQA